MKIQNLCAKISVIEPFTHFKIFASANNRDEMTSSLFLAPRKRFTTHGDRVLPIAGDLSMR